MKPMQLLSLTLGLLLISTTLVIVGHIGAAAFQQHHPQSRIHVRIAPANLCGDGDFFAKLGKNLSALSVDGTLKVLNLRPFAMSCHIVQFGSL